MKIFEKTYTDESLHDLVEEVYDIGEAFSFPVDENGFRRGTFKVTVIWKDSIE